MVDTTTATVSIPLTQGRVVIIDAADLPLVAHLHWTLVKTGESAYARSAQWFGKRLVWTAMHQLILGTSGIVDHKDGDGLNNTRSNLRLASFTQNKQNSKRYANNKSGFKGVSRSRNSWQAQITVNGRVYRRRGFKTPEDAAHFYDDHAREHFGEFACVNFPASPFERAAG